MAFESLASLALQMKEMSMHIFYSGVIVFLPALMTLLSLSGCGSFKPDLEQESVYKNNERASSLGIILAAEHNDAGSTLHGEKSINLSLHRDDQLITVDYADVIGRGPKYYGVEYSWIDQDQDLFLDRYRRLYGNIVRVQISQELFEPINDNNDPNYSEIDFSVTIPIDNQMGKTMTYESMFKSLADRFPGMHFQINIWLCARWNATNPNGYLDIGGAFPPKDYAEHREFIRELARWLVYNCGILSDHLSFTFINEPNLKGFFVGSRNDLARMAEETRIALDQVSPLIQMGGLDEVHGTSWTDQFYSRRSGKCCDIWTFHVYERGLAAMWKALNKRTKHLSQCGPVWVTEFADTANGSPDAKMNFSTREAALGFAELLGRLWTSGVDGIIHFRLSDTYADHFRGWVGHGLFSDSRGTLTQGRPYEPYPVYWLFANMYRELGSGQIVRTKSPHGLTVVGVRKGKATEAQLALWITNSTARNHSTLITVNNFPAKCVRLQVIDNLAGDQPIESVILSGEPLNFIAKISQRSSYLFVIHFFWP